MSSWLERRWYRPAPAPLGLRPLAALYGQLAARRRQRYQSGAKPVYRAPVPVLIVGNISVGGTGKTPLTQSLCRWLRDQGWRPGIISRGYGGRSQRYPLRVDAEATAATECGDEPLLLALSTGCPVVVDPNRSRAAEHLLATTDSDLIISDDGLQHYALGRDIEIAVVDGERGLGNGALLPAGPLREPAARLAEVDLVAINGGDWTYPDGHRFTLQSEAPLRLDGEPAELTPGAVHAVAGIGNPGRFFATLRELGFEPIEHPLPDHHALTETELQFDDGLPVLMTAKDAVKCRAFRPDNRYYLPVSARLPAAFFATLEIALQRLQTKGC